MTKGDREGRIFLPHPHTNNGFFSCSPLNTSFYIGKTWKRLQENPEFTEIRHCDVIFNISMTSQISVWLLVFYLSHGYLAWVKTTETRIWCARIFRINPCPSNNFCPGNVCFLPLLQISKGTSHYFWSWKQTLWTLIRLLLREQSDLGSYCLQYSNPMCISRCEQTAIVVNDRESIKIVLLKAERATSLSP